MCECLHGCMYSGACGGLRGLRSLELELTGSCEPPPPRVCVHILLTTELLALGSESVFLTI